MTKAAPTKPIPTQKLASEIQAVFDQTFSGDLCAKFNEKFGDVVEIPKDDKPKSKSND